MNLGGVGGHKPSVYTTPRHPGCRVRARLGLGSTQLGEQCSGCSNQLPTTLWSPNHQSDVQCSSYHFLFYKIPFSNNSKPYTARLFKKPLFTFILFDESLVFHLKCMGVPRYCSSARYLFICQKNMWNFSFNIYMNKFIFILGGKRTESTW